MTVKELIEELAKMDPNMTVVTAHWIPEDHEWEYTFMDEVSGDNVDGEKVVVLT